MNGTDWPQMFIDLEQLGYKVPRISTEIRVSRTTLLHWRRDNTQPLYGPGESFVKLWTEVTGKTRDELPEKCPDFDKRRAI